jgi:aldehyde oxidoreductase
VLSKVKTNIKNDINNEKGEYALKKVCVTINGKQREVECSTDDILLDLLRRELKLTGAKQSCDRKGQCGACTVIVNGKAVRSCLQKVEKLEGANIITVEGLGTPDNPHLIQEAFVLSGAIQCGFCIPGMVMRTKGLLDANPSPTVPEIKKAFAHNLCRCTGYAKIIDAVQLSAQFIRGENSPEKERSKIGTEKIGISHPRPSAMIKACGTAEFGADIPLENALHVAVVHSTEHHAVIKHLDTETASKMPGVVGIMTADDIKGTNRIRAIVPDQPVLCEDVVRTLGDPIAIVAAETSEQARSAATKIRVEYEPLPVMMTPQESLAEGAYQIHKHSENLCFTQPQIRGDAEKALAGAAVTVEASFSTQMNHQACLEPEVSAAYLDGSGKNAELVVYGRSIQINTLAEQIKEAVGWEKVRYKEPFVGGQFGIKAHHTTEAIAAAAAIHFKRPVRYIPSLAESMLITSKRHPFYMNVKMGADADGRFTGYVNEFIVDKGAYFLIGPIIPLRALLMLSGPYHINDIHAMAKLAYTNNASGGAARGAGPPQVAFAMESAIDMLADQLGMDKLEIRKLNSLKAGEATSTGETPEQWFFAELCDAIQPHWEKAKKAAAAHKDGTVRRGVGLGCHSFGIGEPDDAAQLFVEMDRDDGITIYAAIADPGEGNDSMLTQIAAHTMDLPLEKVRLYTRDTDKTVEMGPSAGSRMTLMAGGALLNALSKLTSTLKEINGKSYADLKAAGKPVRFEGTVSFPGGPLDPKTGQGPGFATQVHNIQMAEVEVDTETGRVRVLKITSALDAGTIIHPQNFEGQNEGGMDQGVGWALREEYVHGQTHDWKTFKFPTMEQSFDVEYVFQEEKRINAPLGATGIGEMTMTSTAPAVINAINDACGVRIYDLPATPEKITAALGAKT